MIKINISAKLGLTDIEIRLVFVKEKGESEREEMGIWDQQRQNIIYRQDKQQGSVLLYIAQGAKFDIVINHNGKDYICVCV